MAGRKRRTDSVLPLQGKVRAALRPYGRSVEAHWPPLTPEHGFPSLSLARAQGAPPLSAPGWAGTPVWFLPPSGQKCQKNSGYPWVSTVKVPYELPPVALPTSGKRVEAFASSQPAGSPVFCPIMAPEHRAVKAVFQRDGLDKRKAAAYTVPRKGVLGRGLRGGCIPSTSPDLGNANVGMRRKTDIFPQTGALAVNLWMNGRLSGVSPLRGSSAFFFRTTAAPER